jgi:Transcriptional regulators
MPFFCGNDTTALSVLLYCKENKISVPGDVALVGFSDEPFSALVTPSISTVRQPGYQMGQQAALRIISRIEAQNSDFPFETKSDAHRTDYPRIILHFSANNLNIFLMI